MGEVAKEALPPDKVAETVLELCFSTTAVRARTWRNFFALCHAHYDVPYWLSIVQQP